MSLTVVRRRIMWDLVEEVGFQLDLEKLGGMGTEGMEHTKAIISVGLVKWGVSMALVVPVIIRN